MHLKIFYDYVNSTNIVRLCRLLLEYSLKIIIFGKIRAAADPRNICREMIITVTKGA